MILSEIKVSGVNKAVDWLDKKLQKADYDTRISNRGSSKAQYLHVIAGTDSVTIRVIDTGLPNERGESFDYDYTLYVGTIKQPKHQKKDRVKQTIKPEDVITFIDTKLSN